MSDDSAVVRNHGMIANNLAILVKNKCMLSAALGGKDTILTALVDVNHKTSTVIFDTSPSEALNKKVVLTRVIRFSGRFEGVQVAFSGSDVTRVRHGGFDAFSMPFPDSVFWFDRRGAYRIATPIRNFSMCQFTITPPEEESTAEYKFNYEAARTKVREQLAEKIEEDALVEEREYQKKFSRMTKEEKVQASIERQAFLDERELNPILPDEEALNVFSLRVLDISMGGCAMFNDVEEFSYFLNQGNIYNNCVITMPDHGVVEVSMELMLKRLPKVEDNIEEEGHTHHAAKGLEEYLGFKIVEASQTAESVIFRYIQLLDRIAKNR
jgi:c-di-GMP-binding flagellar brake protein YcgR